MTKIVYQKISSLDEMELLSSIEDIIIETKAHDQKSNSIINWSWQFKNLPSKSSHIYIAKLNNRIIGYYHIPTFQFMLDKQIINIGNVQSVAIKKEYRNRGIFENLSKYAQSDVNRSVDLLYTFPNDKSIHTFIKYNDYTFLKTLPVYIFPINLFKIFNSKLPNFISKMLSNIFINLNSLRLFKINENEKIKQTNIISNENLNLIKHYNSQFKYHLLRDEKFLKWKYVDSAKSKYYCMSFSTDSKIQASIIFRFDKMFNHNCVVIMDYAYNSLLSMKKLLSNLNETDEIKSKDLSFIMLTGLSRDLHKISKCGFFRVPNFLIPRKLNLLIKSCSDKIHLKNLNKDDW